MRPHHLARLQAAFDAEGERKLRAGQTLPDPPAPAPWYDRLLIGVTGLLGVAILVRGFWG